MMMPTFMQTRYGTKWHVLDRIGPFGIAANRYFTKCHQVDYETPWATPRLITPEVAPPRELLCERCRKRVSA